MESRDSPRAERLGDKTLARAVGQAMGENPTPIIMPSILAPEGPSAHEGKTQTYLSRYSANPCSVAAILA